MAKNTQVSKRVIVKVPTPGNDSTSLGDNSVTTNKIADLAVTSNKIADLAVTSNKIADLAVTSNKIQTSPTLNGNVGISTTSPAVKLHIETEGTSDGIRIVTANSGEGGQLDFYTSNGTLAVKTNSLNNQILGDIFFRGYANSTVRPGALIRAFQETTSTSNTVPSSILFYTGDGVNTLSERMRIHSTGRIGIGFSSSINSPSATVDIGGSSDITQLSVYQNVNNGGSTTVALFGDDRGFNAVNTGRTVDIYQNISTSSAGTLLNARTSSLDPVFRVLANGNIGIGTSPLQTLDILHATGIYLHNSVSNNTQKVARLGSLSYANSAYFPLIWSTSSGAPGTNDSLISIGGGTSSGYAANNVVFYTAANDTTITGTEKMKINSTGNIGIGTAGGSISARLHVKMSALTYGNGIRLEGGTSDNCEWFWSADNICDLDTRLDGGATGGNLRLNPSGGRVNIGGSLLSSAGKLEILHSDTSTNTIFGQNANTGIRLQNTNATNNNFTHITNVNSAGTLSSMISFINVDHSTPNTTSRIDFTTRSGASLNLPMSLLGDGTIGIGTSSTTSGSKLDIRATGNSTIGILHIVGTAAPGSGNKWLTMRDWTNTSTFFYVNDSGHLYTGNIGIGIAPTANQLDLSADTARKLSTTTWATGSDSRLKENIVLADLDICYNTIKNLPLKRFSWKSSIPEYANVEDRNAVGWIAQDVQAFFPNAVKAADEMGLVDCLSLQPDQIYKAMYGALQKSISLIETLQTENQLLLSELASIEARLTAAGI